MTDAKLRSAARAAETGDVHDQARLLIERLRAGRLSRERLGLAAYCGSEVARAAVGVGVVPVPLGPSDAPGVAGDWESVDAGPPDHWARGLIAWEPAPSSTWSPGAEGYHPVLAIVAVEACRYMLRVDAEEVGAAHGDAYNALDACCAAAALWIDEPSGMRAGEWARAWHEADANGVGRFAPSPADARNARVLAETVGWCSVQVGLNRAGLKAAIREAAARWALDGEA